MREQKQSGLPSVFHPFPFNMPTLDTLSTEILLIGEEACYLKILIAAKLAFIITSVHPILSFSDFIHKSL